MLTFGEVIDQLKSNRRCARSGWNGKGMYIEIRKPTLNSDMTLPFICMKTVDNQFVPWLASQTDILSEDWVVV